MSRSFEDSGGRSPLIIKDLDLYPQPPTNTHSPTLNSEEPNYVRNVGRPRSRFSGKMPRTVEATPTVARYQVIPTVTGSGTKVTPNAS